MKINCFLTVLLMVNVTKQSGAESENIEYLMIFVIFGVLIGLFLLGVK